eukprot:3052921-Rhodomonas_salina.2
MEDLRSWNRTSSSVAVAVLSNRACRENGRAGGRERACVEDDARRSRGAEEGWWARTCDRAAACEGRGGREVRACGALGWCVVDCHHGDGDGDGDGDDDDDDDDDDDVDDDDVDDHDRDRDRGGGSADDDMAWS